MLKKKILFVKPSDLYGLVLYNIVGKELVFANENLPFYQPYRRNNRNDIIIKVPSTDLEQKSVFIIHMDDEKC